MSWSIAGRGPAEERETTTPSRRPARRGRCEARYGARRAPGAHTIAGVKRSRAHRRRPFGGPTRSNRIIAPRAESRAQPVARPGQPVGSPGPYPGKASTPALQAASRSASGGKRPSSSMIVMPLANTQTPREARIAGDMQERRGGRDRAAGPSAVAWQRSLGQEPIQVRALTGENAVRGCNVHRDGISAERAALKRRVISMNPSSISAAATGVLSGKCL